MVDQTRNQGADPLREHYLRLWRTGIESIRAGSVSLDPVLAAGNSDLRRGLTVILRPSPKVRRRVAAFLRSLRALEPEQYYYAPTELHVTFLSLFAATAEHARYFAQAALYREAVDAALRTLGPFGVVFRGITATPEAVLIQGFPEDERLNEGRNCLRRELRARGLGEGLDGRYRLVTAHLTALRFRQPLRNSDRLAGQLQSWRDFEFGATRAATLSLVKNDWYMSSPSIERLKQYRLSRGGCPDLQTSAISAEYSQRTNPDPGS